MISRLLPLEIGMFDVPAQPLQIAIDGYAATGKSTIGQAVANQLGILYVDTGVMYRAVALLVLEAHANPLDEVTCATIARSMDLEIVSPTVNDGRQMTVQIGNRDVTWDIRSEAVNRLVAKASSHTAVRSELIERQRRIARAQPIVMVGRDITSVVLPHAPVKVILKASLRERVRRRIAELQLRQPGTPVDAAAIRQSIQARDKLDSREMKAKRQAVIIKTDKLTISQVVSRIVQLCLETENR